MLLTRGHADPGLQPERTVLAWHRTLLSLGAVSLLFMRWLPHHRPLALISVGLVWIAAFSIWLRLGWRYRQSVESMRRNQSLALGLEVLTVSLTVCMLGGIGIYTCWATL